MSDIIFFRNPSYGPLLAFRASATSATDQITVPASAAAGDFGLLVDYASSAGSAPTAVVPSGWDTIDNTTSFLYRGVIMGKVLTGSEASSTLTGMNGDSLNSKVLLIFSGGIISYAAQDIDATITINDPSSQTVTAGSSSKHLIVVGISGDHSAPYAAAFTTASPAFDATVVTSAADYLRVGYKIYNTGQANHSVDMGDRGNSNYLATCYLEMD